MITAFVCALLTAEPITPSQLHDALQVPPRGATAERLAERIRAAYREGTDLKQGGKPLVDGGMVAFVVEAEATPSRPARVTGMVNHGRGYDLVPIGETGLWARIELIPTDTKFAYAYTVGERPMPIPWASALSAGAPSRCPAGAIRRSLRSSQAGATARPSHWSSAAPSSTTSAPARSTFPPPTSPTARRQG
jgi:hypothetical protein